ncbi:hypothetical protein DB346_19210 [Verrucomicrobia bacterium LW23]|nr:hypothetical protein DB346_19210 [Verrucomicrobia bacterium LW23]
MDLYTLIPLLVLAYSLFMFVTLWRRSGGDSMATGWLLVSGGLTAFAGALIWMQRHGGVDSTWVWVCLGLFFLLVLVPTLLLRMALRFQEDHFFTASWLAATGYLILHPFPAAWYQWQLARFLAVMGGGSVDQGADMLRHKLATGLPKTPLDLAIVLTQMRVLQHWDDIARLIESLSPETRAGQGIAYNYLLALGEAGRTAEMFAVARKLAEAEAEIPPGGEATYLVPACHAGRLDLVISLINGPVPGLNHQVKELWLARTLQRAGKAAEAQKILERLARSYSLLVQQGARLRLSHPYTPDPAAAGPDARYVLQHVEEHLRDEGLYIEPSRYSPGASTGDRASTAQPGEDTRDPRESQRNGDGSGDGDTKTGGDLAATQRAFTPYVTWTLAGLCAAIFFIDSSLPGSPPTEFQVWLRSVVRMIVQPLGDYLMFYQAGVYDYTLLTEGREYWRIFTPLFLHANVLHIGFNCMALLSMGPDMEYVLGRGRFLLLYLLSGMAGTAAMTWFIAMGWMEPLRMLGASGCIMGIVGATAWVLLHRTVWEGHAMSREGLIQIVMLLALQTFMDLNNPQVSFTAHSVGAITGFILAIPLYWSTGRAAERMERAARRAAEKAQRKAAAANSPATGGG